MSESNLKLNDKTLIVYGPIKSIVHSLASSFVEQGADVALIDAKAEESSRFVNNLMEMRQVHHKYGRCAAINQEIHSKEDARETISKAAELFGSVDILIDASFRNRDFSNEYEPTQLLTDEVLHFFQGRNKGRIIYFTYNDELLKIVGDNNTQKNNTSVYSLCKKTARELIGQNITANCISVGITDDFLMNYYPDKIIKNSIEEIQQKIPHAKITDPIQIANIAVFLGCPLSAAITGQTLSVGHGLNL